MFPKLPITLNLNQTIEQLEGKVFGEPPTSSHVVTTTYALRKKPLDEFTVEDLRIMLGQQCNPEFLLPLALNILTDEPLAEGDYYAGDLLQVLLRFDESVWNQHQDWWLQLQLIMYQVEYELPEVDLTQVDFHQALQTFRQLQASVAHLHPIIQVMQTLHQPNTLVQSGGVVILYLYGRWHLLVVVNGIIKSVHFMTAAGPWRLWSILSVPPEVKSFQAVGENFELEVSKKVLPSAKDYLIWLHQGMEVVSGPTSDALWRKHTPEEPQEFLQVIQEAMDHEHIGVAFSFPG